MGVSFLALQPNINLLLNNLQGKRAAFDGAASGLLDTRSLIRDSITIQQNTAKDLGASVSLRGSFWIGASKHMWELAC